MFHLRHGKVINNFYYMSKFKPTGEQSGLTENELNFSNNQELEDGRQTTQARQKKEARERLSKACETDDPQKLEAAREHLQNFDTHSELEQVTEEMEKLVAAMLDRIRATKLYDDVIADYGDEMGADVSSWLSLNFDNFRSPTQWEYALDRLKHAKEKTGKLHLLKRHGVQKIITLVEQILKGKEMTQLRKLEPTFLKLLGQKGQLRERINKRNFEATQRHLRGE